MYLLIVTLFIVSVAVLTTAQRCPIQDVKCDCSQPQTLACSLKKLSELRSGNLFRYLNNNRVRRLSLAFSGYREFPPRVLPSHEFSELLIDGKDLTDVRENAFHGLEETLQTLRLRYGRFEKIPVNAIKRLKVLNHLDMEGNNITKLHQSLRGLTLRGLNLNRNKISWLEKNILPRTLEDLGLRKNNLYRLNRALSGNIKDLDISDNHIISLNGELEELPELEKLNASYNRIEDFRVSTFAKFPKLKTLYLSNNMIRSLSDDSFTSLRNLRYLDVSGNGLVHVSGGAFRNLQALRGLNLSSNHLESLSEDTMDVLESLVELDISSNNLHDLTFLRRAFRQDLGRHHVLRMKDSGIQCHGRNREIIRNLEWRGVSIEGNPCWSQERRPYYD